MIEIKIEAASGAEAREQMLGLLGLNTNVTVSAKDIALISHPITKVGDGISSYKDLPVAEETTSQAEEPKKKRRTKGEMEADALKANTGSEEPPASEETAPTIEQANEGESETPQPEVPTLNDVKYICSVLVRAGKKNEAIAMVKECGVETSPEIPEDKRAGFIAKMKAFADENNIAY